MKRRIFSKTIALAALAQGLPLSALNFSQGIGVQELLGKGAPVLQEGANYKLRPPAANAFELMKKAALKDGISLQVVSSYRNYAHQNRIWERKYKRFRKSGLSPTQSISKIIEYSTIPGTSRHHWGADLDIIDGNPKVNGDVLVPSKFHGTGPFCAMKEWMDENAVTFDFYLVYTDEADRKGFNYEPWHYSYAPLSIKYLTEYRKLDIKSLLEKEQLMGSEHFETTFMSQYISENILDINPELLG